MVTPKTPEAGSQPTAAGVSLRFVTPGVLLALAAVGWWWSARMADDITSGSGSSSMGMAGMASHEAMSLSGFLVAWLAMMTAMMFPAISPVVKLYGRAAAAGRVAPLPFFVLGYIAVWTSVGLPAYVAWRELMDPIVEGRPWAGRLAGLVLLTAAVWQLTPLKSVCLRHCRSPLSFFMRFGTVVTRPWGAMRMGGNHGLYCLGCCWALMAVLVALGTMNLAWMLALATLILLEKNAPAGQRIAQAAAAAFVAIGLLLILRPETITTLA